MEMKNLKDWIANGGLEEQIKEYGVPKNEQHAQRWGTLYDYVTTHDLDPVLEHASALIECYESGKDVSAFIDEKYGLDTTEKKLAIPSLADAMSQAKDSAEKRNAMRPDSPPKNMPDLGR